MLLLPLLTVIAIVADGDGGNTVVVVITNIVGDVAIDAFVVVIDHEGVSVAAAMDATVKHGGTYIYIYT